MPEGSEPICLAGSPLGQSRHICAFFHSRDEEYQVLLPFIKEGLECGQRGFHIVDPEHRDDHLRRLEATGIEPLEREQAGQLDVRVWREAYLREERFDQERMLALIEEVLIDGHERGFPLTRLVANMEWALEERPGVQDIIEYETRLNYVLPKYNDVVCCTYDLSKFGGQIVLDILRTHPMVIIGGIIQENPFFVQPDEMLRELQARAAPRNAAA